MDFKEAIKTRNRMCRHYGDKCLVCPLGSQHNGTENECDVLINDTPELAEPILEKWAEENKPLTNAEKFKEVFPNVSDYFTHTCVREFATISREECAKRICQDCENLWWNAPYEPPKEG